MPLSQSSLLRELAAILRDYQARIVRLGPETLRMRGESFEQWEGKRRRIDLVRELLERTVRASDDGKLAELLHQVAEAPERVVPAELLRPPPEPVCSRCLRRLSHHRPGPGSVDHDCPDGFCARADP